MLTRIAIDLIHDEDKEDDKAEATMDDEEEECQPTGSIYSPLWAFLTCNLSWHVEHHDFPRVPCRRLARAHAAAPEFYAALRRVDGWANGFAIIGAYLCDADSGFYYGCVAPPKKKQRLKHE